MTSFQKQVYSLVSKVPAGKVTTYKLLGQALDTHAYQAIGQALKVNPNAPEVPCHRVVKSNGDLGGYSGKLNHSKKKELLVKEGVKIKRNQVVNLSESLFVFKYPK